MRHIQNYILSITDNNNFGNRLQNFAVQEFLINHGIEAKTLWKRPTIKEKMKNVVKLLFPITSNNKRFSNFYKFTKHYINIKYISNYNNLESLKVDKLFVGSDQILNLKWQYEKVSNIKYVPKNSVYALCASFGINEISESEKKEYFDVLSLFGRLSVREESGARIVKEITGRDDTVVLTDPTMLIAKETWQKIAKKPNFHISENYVLCYFLGEMVDEYKTSIEEISRKHGCQIINLMDKDSEIFSSGPCEFIYLIERAKYVFTDSFHACVFSILFNKPFIVFRRKDNISEDMYSRIDNLINLFELHHREYNGQEIEEYQLDIKYEKVNNILCKEREKAEVFINSVL